jgi:predicted metal-dependent phosphoesterase TrpH
VGDNYPENCFAHPAIIHCHSTYSDGTKDIPEIAAIAESVGVRILMMTDHNHLRPLKDGTSAGMDLF